MCGFSGSSCLSASFVPEKGIAQVHPFPGRETRLYAVKSA